MKPGIIVHGGAGRWSLVFSLAEEEGLNINERLVKASIREAALLGLKVLRGGGSALDAVTEAIKYMEDSGVFNAGVASSLDAEGNITMDAGIMDGASRQALGVACLRYPRNPILLTRKLLGKTDHVILACECADRLARRLGLEPHPGPHPRAKAFWRWAHRQVLERGGKGVWERNLEVARLLGLLGGDTVGAVAVDDKGNVAAGVSTGGVTYKIPGRVGDSPIPGAGFYALNGVGGAAATGLGEAIIIAGLSLRAVEMLGIGETARVASLKSLRLLEDLTGKWAGLIILSSSGEYHAAYNTEAMPWAYASADTVESGLWRT